MPPRPATGPKAITDNLGVSLRACAVAMAFARVYVGPHYPSDVLARLALGGAVASIGAVLVVPSLARSPTG